MLDIRKTNDIIKVELIMDEVVFSQSDRNEWDYQDYELTEAYRIFSTYYLPLRPPRTLRHAFENFLINENGMARATAKKTPMPPNFLSWALSLDKHGDKIPDTLSWHERAVLYDEARFGEYKDQIKGTQLNTVLAEINDIEQIEKQWEVLYGEFQAWALHAREQAKLASQPYNPDREITRFKELLEIREKIAQFNRRAVGLPVKYNELPSTEKEDLFKMEWNEPARLPEPKTVDDVDRIIEILKE